jgi:hypothetical protein
MRYTEAVVTMDLDVLVDMPCPDSLAILSPIYDFCRAKGYLPEGEAIRVGDWPIQFIPAFDNLSREAMECAEETDLDGAPIRVVKADYLAVMALKTNRAKDKARILALLEAKAIIPEDIAPLAARHSLDPQWTRFKAQFLL